MAGPPTTHLLLLYQSSVRGVDFIGENRKQYVDVLEEDKLKKRGVFKTKFTHKR
jgi:hypothetical protein